jgi:hypothetical protein
VPRSLDNAMTNDKPVPRRERLVELLTAVVVGLALGGVVLVVIDGLTALLGWGRFGEISGWLAGVLPVWLFVEEYKAWREVPTRIVLALVSTALAIPLALAAATLASGPLPPLASGAIGVSVGALAYAVLWYVGIRWLADRTERGVSR